MVDSGEVCGAINRDGDVCIFDGGVVYRVGAISAFESDGKAQGSVTLFLKNGGYFQFDPTTATKAVEIACGYWREGKLRAPWSQAESEYKRQVEIRHAFAYSERVAALLENGDLKQAHIDLLWRMFEAVEKGKKAA